MDISGSNYQILDSHFSVIYTSTSSSTAFNHLLGSSGIASDGSSVYVNAGTYTVDATWTVNVDSITLTFASGAKLIAIANLNTYMIAVSSNNCIINGANVNGNAVSQYHGSDTSADNFDAYYYIGGILLGGQHDLIEYSTIFNCRQWGVISGGNHSGIMNSTINDVGWNGFSTYQNSESGTVNEAFCINCNIYDTSDVGIDSQSQNTIITGNTVYNMGPHSDQPQGSTNSYWGIAWENNGFGTMGGTGSGTYALCAGNTLTNVGVGIVITGSTSTGTGTINYIIISGNTVTNAQRKAIDFSDSSYDIITSNNITTAAIGINLHVDTGSAVNNIVYGNTYSVCTANFNDGGSGTITSAPSIVVITVTSSPAGQGYITADGNAGYAGCLSTTPYIFYDAVGNSVSLVANTVSGHAFRSWSDGGAQSHMITVPSSNIIYTATY